MKNSIDFWKEKSYSLSLKQKVGQLFMPAAFINDSEEEITRLEALIKNACIGGICFFHSRESAATNYEGKKEIPYNADSFQTLRKLVTRYQKAAKIPLLIAIDAEWGLAMRIENTPQYPYALTLGALQGETDLIYKVGLHIGADCRAAGIHWNFAPVADINSNPDNPVIGYRSFGSNRSKVSKNALAFSRGMQQQGILSCAKHFPGHGDTATDSHLGLPVISKSRSELREHELAPFSELIQDGVDAVMIGHLAVPALTGDNITPATLSDRLIKGTLRQEMGFEGVVVSDALNMHAVSKHYPEKGELEFQAFSAGIDVFCFSEHPEEGINKISDRGAREDIETAFRRVWELKSRCYWDPGTVHPILSDCKPLNLEIAQKCLTAYQGETTSQAFPDAEWMGVQIGAVEDNLFFKRIMQKRGLQQITIDWEKAPSMDQIRSGDRYLLAIFPPSVKPTNRFGCSEATLALINGLLQSEKVTLYLFGNPYFLNLLQPDPDNTIIIAYQNFGVFQEVAADHFLGKCPAPGQLPIQLK